MRNTIVDVNGNPLFSATNPAIVSLTGSNFEQTLGAALPAKANLIGLSDGTNIRAMLGNTQGTLLASAARTASAQSPDIINYNGKGILVTLDITLASGTGGLRVQIYYKTVSGKVVQINPNPPTILANGTYGYEVYPGSSTAGAAGNYLVNQRTQAVVPKKFYVLVTALDTTSYTYSLDYEIIL